MPSLALIIFMALLIHILRAMVNVQGLYMHSEARKSVLRFVYSPIIHIFSKYFTFLVVNVFLGMLLISSAFNISSYVTQIQFTYITSGLDVVNLLATSIPKQCNFFINYILLNSLLSYSLFLLRPGYLIINLLKTTFLGKSLRDQKDLSAPPVS